jgi:hypothetical protein
MAMKTGLFVALGLAALAGGCITIEERRALDAEQCRGYGFRAGTDAFAQCMQEIDLDRAASRRAFAYREFGGPYGGIGFGYGFRRW